MSQDVRDDEHAMNAAWHAAQSARAEGRFEEAVAALKRALHHTRDVAACRAIFEQLADIHRACGEHGEASYYAKRASRVGTSSAPPPRARTAPPPPPPQQPRAAEAGAYRPPPPPPPRRPSPPQRPY